LFSSGLSRAPKGYVPIHYRHRIFQSGIFGVQWWTCQAGGRSSARCTWSRRDLLPFRRQRSLANLSTQRRSLGGLLNDVVDTCCTLSMTFIYTTTAASHCTRLKLFKWPTQNFNLKGHYFLLPFPFCVSSLSSAILPSPPSHLFSFHSFPSSPSRSCLRKHFLNHSCSVRSLTQ